MVFQETVRFYSPFLYPDSGKSGGRINLSCETHRLYLIFVDPDEPMSQNTYDPSRKLGIGYQPIDMFPVYMDLLRNEGPITVTFNPDSSPPSFVVFSAPEPPAEGEM